MAHLGVTPAFWKGRRVLLTGHTGFKGGWLSLWLHSMGAKVYGFALPPTGEASFFQVARIAEGMDHALGDLRDAAQLAAAVHAAQPEIIFHLGAQSLVRQSYVDPEATFATNVMGTVHLLEAIRKTPSVKALLVVTSDKCYENHERPEPYREEDAMGGKDPYSASKGCVELLTAAWRDSFLQPQIAVATARAGNVIGGGDWASDRLIPDALRSWEENKSLSVRYPKAVRPWQYHLDALSGYLTLAAEMLNGKQSGAWNFGPTDADMLPVEEVLQRLTTAWGSKVQWETTPVQQPHEATQLRLDSSKARTQLGWQSMYSINDSLRAIVDWHQAWRNGKDMRAYSLNQIEQYRKTLG